MSFYGKNHWARRALEWRHASAEAKAQLALRCVNKRAARRECPQDKPKVTVIKAQGKPMLVFISGPMFVSAFTWDRLLYKAVYGQWKSIAGTTLAKRLP